MEHEIDAQRFAQTEIRVLVVQALLEHVMGSAFAFVPDGAARLDAMKRELTSHLTGAAAGLTEEQTRITKEQIERLFIRTAKLRAESVATRSK